GVAINMARNTMRKHKVGGGLRLSSPDGNTHRITAAVRGSLCDSSCFYQLWQGSAYTETGDACQHAIPTPRIAAAALGCDDPTYGTFQGCQPYDIWTDNSSPEAAQAMAGTSFSVYKTSYRAFSVEANGYLGFGFPSADGEEIGLAIGMER